MAGTFMAMDTTDEVYFGQFGIAHTMLDAPTGMATILNALDQYHDKVFVANMNLSGSGKPHPLSTLSECPVFLYRFDPADPASELARKRGPWILLLKDQPAYPRIK
jgi:hypothetical protein